MSPKNLARRWLLALILPLIVAACQPQLPPLPATPPTPAVRVAILLPTTGELATFGQKLRNGMQLAFDQTSQQFELTLYPTDCTFESGQLAARQALAQGHTLLLGPLCSTAAIGAAIEADTAGALLIAPATPHPLVTQNSHGDTRKTIFRVSHTAAAQGQAAAQFANNSLQRQRAAIFTPSQDSYASQLADAFEQTFTGQVVLRQSFSPAETDPGALLTAARQAGAQVIYLPATADVANRFGPPFSNQGLELLGSDQWDSPELDRLALNGSYFPIRFDAAATHPAVQNFVERYKSTYAIAPGTLAALGFDAASLLTQALRQTSPPQPAALAQTLAANTFQGVTGPISFDASHNPRQPVVFARLIEGQAQPQTVRTP